MAAAGWFADPAGRHEVRFYDGTAWTDQVADNGLRSQEPLSTAYAPHQAYAGSAPSVDVARPIVVSAGPRYRGPARTAHGPVYWLLIGWWWGPTKWLGRVMLWLFLWPVGLWRSIVHGRKNREARERRGYR